MTAFTPDPFTPLLRHSARRGFTPYNHTSPMMLSRVVRHVAGTAQPRRLRTHACQATCLLALFAAATAAAQTPTRAAKAAALARASDAILTIVAYREGTGDVTSGTAIRTPDGRVITALRHLRGASRADVYSADGDSLATFTTLDQADVKLDLAILPKVAAVGPSIALGRKSAILAQKVSLLGRKKGTVRAIADRTVTRVEPDDVGRVLLRLGTPITGAAVGSAVVNTRGELLAVALGVIPGREEGDIAIDVASVRDLLARPSARLAFPARDGTITAARTVDPRGSSGATSGPPKPADAATKPRGGSIFPERYGTAISADTAGAWGVELFGCARLESRQKVYCYLRITNLATAATITINGGDLADSTRRKLREANNLIFGETSYKLAGWRNKATIPVRELDAIRVALEFPLSERDGVAVRLILDVGGERTLFLGPFILQKVP